jgi:hypothetical protein
MIKQTLSFGKNLLIIAFLPMTSLLVLSQAALADTLRTKDFRVTITNNCPEGEVACNNVNYHGVNVNTGASVQLLGRTLHTSCADGVTPCRFVGYEFSNGNYRYLVTEEGSLQVYQNGKLVLNQRGNWER